MDPAVFFTPHQDDEVLSMGAGIAQHVAEGRRVIVVLCTDGGNSGVYTGGTRGWSSKAAFVAERDREFRAACAALGAEAVVHPNRMPDAQLTVAGAKAIIQEYINLYPNGSFKTMSDRDRTRAGANPDHYLLGDALRQTGVADARYYIYDRNGEWDAIAGSLTPVYDLENAQLAYASVGWHSVRTSFTSKFKAAQSKYHT